LLGKAVADGRQPGAEREQGQDIREDAVERQALQTPPMTPPNFRRGVSTISASVSSSPI
jgi:hypothetical protein